MTANLFSRDWYRIADLKPALRKHVKVHAHRYRGKRWYVLEDTVTGQNRRLSEPAYWIIGLMNGRRTVDDLWTLSADRLGDEMPTHEELIQLISSLYQGNLVKIDGSGDIAEMFEREYAAKRNKRLAKLKSPLSIQIPLYDPDKFILATQKYVEPVFTRLAAFIWIAGLLFLLFSGWQNWDALTQGVTDRVLTADNLLLMWFLYPLIKLIHEFGHAYAVRRFGGEVHEMGVMLLVMMPVPYVDASASGVFKSKYQRMLVGAAGIMVELFIGALAMAVWISAEPGLVKSLAYNTLFIAGVSTVLVNGNPLLRFDGYYVFADFLEIPNLSQKANQAWAWILKRLLFDVRGQERPGETDREFAWLAVYGLAAIIYRVFLTITIVLFVAGKYFVIGVVLAIWSFIGVWLWPAIRNVRKAWDDGDIRREGRDPSVVVPMVSAILFALLFLMPLPLTTSVEGVVQYGEEARVVAGESCFVTWVLPPNRTVEKGDRVASCVSRDLQRTLTVLEAQLQEASARRLGEWDNPVQLKLIDEEVQRLSDEIKETADRISNLSITAVRSGVWWVKSGEDLIGRFVQRGELLGFVAARGAVRVRALVPEQDVAIVRTRTRKVSALSAATNWEPMEANEWSLFPSATRELYSQVLADSGGGVIVPDPSADRPASLEPYFPVDLWLDVGRSGLVEQRVHVRFEHPAEPLAYRLFRVIRRTFLEYFDV